MQGLHQADTYLNLPNIIAIDGYWVLPPTLSPPATASASESGQSEQRRRLHYPGLEGSRKSFRVSGSLQNCNEPLLLFVREYTQQRLLVCFNLSGESVATVLPELGQRLQKLDCPGPASARLQADGRIELPPHGVLFAEIG